MNTDKPGSKPKNGRAKIPVQRFVILHFPVGRKVEFLHTVFAGQVGVVERVSSNGMLIVRNMDNQRVPVFYESVKAI